MIISSQYILNLMLFIFIMYVVLNVFCVKMFLVHRKMVKHSILMVKQVFGHQLCFLIILIQLNFVILDQLVFQTIQAWVDRSGQTHDWSTFFRFIFKKTKYLKVNHQNGKINIENPLVVFHFHHVMYMIQIVIHFLVQRINMIYRGSKN